MDNAREDHGPEPLDGLQSSVPSEPAPPDDHPFARVIRRISSLSAVVEQSEREQTVAEVTVQAEAARQAEAVKRVETPVHAFEDDVCHQEELQAIFGAEGWLGEDELLERANGLPGIHSVVRVKPEDVSMVEATQRQISLLCVVTGEEAMMDGIKLDLVRDGGVLLAVRREGAYAPGVCETLRLVARELGRLARCA
ncbi:MAG TPA: hypothetical protein VIM46_01055 [Luteolibacter sp.]